MTVHAVPIPQLGLTAEEATIVEWRCAFGSHVTAGEIIVVVETEKSEIEVESPRSGWLWSGADAGTVLAIGATMAVITDTMEEPSSTDVAPGPRLPAPAPAADPVRPQRWVTEAPASADRRPPPSVGSDRVVASPAARRRAAERGVDLGTVSGTGPGGRIVEADVEAAAHLARPVHALSPGRQALARAMTASAAIPQLSVGRLAPMAGTLREVAAWRSRGVAVSVTDVLVAAVARALAVHPRFAVRITGVDEIVPVGSIDVALAVPVADHLQAPAIRDADHRDLGELADERRRLVTAVEASTLASGDFGEPCATVSNLGPSGVEAFQALVTPPQSCVLAVGAIRSVPLVTDGVLGVADCAQLWLTADHRIADGVHVAGLLGTIVELLEAPSAPPGAALASEEVLS